jgi:phage tail-like protein
VTASLRQRPYAPLGGYVGWGHAALDAVEIGDANELRLRPAPVSGRPLTDAAGSFGGLAVPTGLAVDAAGRVYHLDAGALLLERFDPCAGGFETLPCVGGEGSGPRRLRRPNGIAVSPGGDLYVADTGNRRVQVFALKGLALRRVVGPLRLADGGVEPVPPSADDDYPDDTWRPWDVAVAPDCRVLVTDAAPGAGAVHVFGRDGRWLEAWTEEEPGVPLAPATHLALDREGRVYVVQEGKDYVVVFDETGRLEGRVREPAEVAGRFCPVSVVLDDRGRILVGEEAGRLGPAAQYEQDGVFVSAPLDSGTFRCEWHRVVMRASVPRGTSVRVDTFTSEAPRSAADLDELADEWATGQVNVQRGDGEWDCLVASPPGRYLWLRLTLRGGSETPAVERVRVEYPRASSLRYLPAVYAEEPESRDFTARFLSIFDTTRDGLASRIDRIATYFDPRATPAADGGGDFLTWLASWVGMTFDRALPVARRRELVRNAYRLYRLRGTPEGMRLHVELTTGVSPMILEHFKLRRWLFLRAARLGDSSSLWGDAIVQRLQLDRYSRIGSFQLLDAGDPLHDPFHHYAHRFTVFVPKRGGVRREVLQAIVDAAKPAHTQATAEVVDPRFRIGVQSLLGLDTVVGAYPGEVVTGTSRLGVDTVLGPSEDEAERPTLRVGVRARIGSTTLID